MMYRQSAHGLEVIVAGEAHGCTGILSGRDRMALYKDCDLNVRSSVALPLHKDVLCGPNTHEVGGRHHRPAETHRGVPKPHAMSSLPFIEILFYSFFFFFYICKAVKKEI